MKPTPLKVILIIAAVLLTLLLLITPKKKTSPDTDQPNPEFTGAPIEIIRNDLDSLLDKVQQLETKQKKLSFETSSLSSQRDSQIQFLESLKIQNQALQQKISTLEEKIEKNRSYISTIYRQLLDIQLKMESIGGGFSVQKQIPNTNQNDDFPDILETMP